MVQPIALARPLMESQPRSIASALSEIQSPICQSVAAEESHQDSTSSLTCPRLTRQRAVPRPLLTQSHARLPARYRGVAFAPDPDGFCRYTLARCFFRGLRPTIPRERPVSPGLPFSSARPTPASLPGVAEGPPRASRPLPSCVRTRFRLPAVALPSCATCQAHSPILHGGCLYRTSAGGLVFFSTPARRRGIRSGESSAVCPPRSRSLRSFERSSPGRRVARVILVRLRRVPSRFVVHRTVGKVT